jgi:hypothetical protein
MFLRRTPVRHRGLSGRGQEALTQALTSFGRASVKGARFRTTISPEVTLGQDVLFAGSQRTGGGGSEAFLRFVRPAVYLDTALGTRVIAPWGEPSRNWFPLLAIGTLVAASVGVGVLIRGLRR